jgi:hypothetical protein
MTTSVKEEINGVSRFVDDLNNAIRENPVSAGLIGLGVLWMFLGADKIASFANALPSTARRVTESVDSAADRTSAAAYATAKRVNETIQDVSNSAKAGTLEAGKDINLATQNATRAANEFGHKLVKSIQQNVTTTVQERPALLGVVGIGIGAGVASMFSSTCFEQDLVGDAASKVQSKIRDIAGQTAHHAENVFNEMKNEAIEQGLTSTSVEESLEAVAAKVKATVAVAKESVLTV